MRKYHEYLSLDRWEPYLEENGENTGAYVYTLPDYRFLRLFSEIEGLKQESEKLKEEIMDLSLEFDEYRIKYNSTGKTEGESNG